MMREWSYPVFCTFIGRFKMAQIEWGFDTSGVAWVMAKYSKELVAFLKKLGYEGKVAKTASHVAIRPSRLEMSYISSDSDFNFNSGYPLVDMRKYMRDKNAIALRAIRNLKDN
jgi:hypothetical protein